MRSVGEERGWREWATGVGDGVGGGAAQVLGLVPGLGA